MCGIVGVISKEFNVAPLIVSMLKKLEYRGYDSAGVALVQPGKVVVKKDRGVIDDIRERYNLTKMEGKVGLGHTRWATHGAPSHKNAHPHQDCRGEIAVVHNGIIENYVELKRELVIRGHLFKSETDTEVIPHLIEEKLAEGLDLKEAVKETVKKLKGSFAIAVVSSKFPHKIVAAKKGSPLVVGVSEEALFIASDIPAFLQQTNKVIFISEEEIVTLTGNKVEIETFNGQKVKRTIQTINWTYEMAQKSGYPHFMLKEIEEQPLAIKETLRSTNGELMEIVEEIVKNEGNLYFVASGTSYHATLAGKYIFAKVAGIPFETMQSSEFTEAIVPTLSPKSLVFAVSQSGETADTKVSLKKAKERGAKTIALTNVLGSSITRIADEVCYTYAGPEIGVAATKTFTSQITLLTYLALKSAEVLGLEVEEKFRKLKKLPQYLSKTLTTSNLAQRIAKEIKSHGDVYFIGRGVGYPVALEGALKLKEISYIHAEGTGAGEYKHGPLALISENTPVVAVVTPGPSQTKMVGNIEEVKARGAKVISIAPEGNKKIEEMSNFTFKINREVDELLSPAPYIVPLQYLAYYTAVLRGLNPDKPRNLAKSVTVE